MRCSRLNVILLALPLLALVTCQADEPKPPQLTPDERKLEAEAKQINDEAVQLYQRGRATEAVVKLQQSLEIRQKLYPETKYPDGHTELATSLNNLGVVLQAMGQAEQALRYFQPGLLMTQRLFPDSKYPEGHADLATSLNNMGGVYQALGQLEQALPYFRQSQEMRQRLYPVAKFPDGHPELAIGLLNLGSALQAMGQSEQALPMFRTAVDMMQKLFPSGKFPNGHPNLALGLNTTGVVLHSLGQPEQALSYFRQGLEMRQKLFPAAQFPNGHPHLATSLNNLGYVLDSLGQSEQALPYFRQGLEMRQKLFPVAHPDLIQSLQNVGDALQAVGQAEDALPCYRQAVAMAEKLFPTAKYADGHPNLARALNKLGGALDALGRSEEALAFYRQSVVMQQRWLRRELASASEEAAFDKIGAEAPYVNAYLTLTATLRTPGDQTYNTVWPSRSLVTRLLEQRQANARAAGTETGAKLDRLRGLRRRTDQLLQDTRTRVEDRDLQLVAVANERDQLDRELVAEIPALKHWQELDKLGPVDLVRTLPPGTAFIDLIRYTRLEYVDKKKRKGTPCYVAFVLAAAPGVHAPVMHAPGALLTIKRVELGEAGPIDTSVREWRAAIDARREPSEAGATLDRLLWQPIAPAIPPGTTTLYVAPDGDLARLPWAALPIGKGRVLLEEYALAQVPHGTFLLDQLKFGKQFDGIASLFTLGGVDYGASTWPTLPGTKVEVTAIAGTAAGERLSASGVDATAARLVELLPKARYAHLATHGQFKADELTKEKQRAAQALATRLQGDDSRKIAAKNPLGYVGLVLANGEILSGLSIVDLPLKNTQLVTLSACETGLGEYTGGEGVQGLQRAFHLAGCPNVVASLWNVDDAATAALMVKFYHELWVKKRPPVEALREAQLTIYHRPDLISGLATERGLKLEKVMESTSTQAAPPTTFRGTAPTKLWAGFALSGVGK